MKLSTTSIALLVLGAYSAACDGSGSPPDVVERSRDAGPLEKPLLARSQVSPSTLRLTATHVYWVHGVDPGRDETGFGSAPGGGVVRIPKEGGPVKTLAWSYGTPDGLALDDQFAYWTDGMTRRVPLDGGTVEIIRSNQTQFSWGLGAEAIYYVEGGSAAISWIPKAGGIEQTFLTPRDREGFDPVRSIRVLGEYVYWTRQAKRASDDRIFTRLYRASIDTRREELIAEEDVKFGDVISDSENVYWTVPDIMTQCSPAGDCKAIGAVRSKPMAGGEPYTIAEAEHSPSSLALDAERIYWSTRSGIRSARKDGSDLKNIDVGNWGSGMLEIAVDDEAVYWCNSDRGAIARASK